VEVLIFWWLLLEFGRKYNPGYADCVWGVDNSSNAVQISVLNMLLNGDGKTNIKKDDSLENVNKIC